MGRAGGEGASVDEGRWLEVEAVGRRGWEAMLGGQMMKFVARRRAWIRWDSVMCERC